MSLALSEEQADRLDQAIVEHRKLKKILAEMRQTSRKIMRLKFPDTERRTPIEQESFTPYLSAIPGRPHLAPSPEARASTC